MAGPNLEKLIIKALSPDKKSTAEISNQTGKAGDEGNALKLKGLDAAPKVSLSDQDKLLLALEDIRGKFGNDSVPVIRPRGLLL